MWPQWHVEGFPGGRKVVSLPNLNSLLAESVKSVMVRAEEDVPPWTALLSKQKRVFIGKVERHFIAEETFPRTINTNKIGDGLMVSLYHLLLPPPPNSPPRVKCLGRCYPSHGKCALLKLLSLKTFFTFPQCVNTSISCKCVSVSVHTFHASNKWNYSPNVSFSSRLDVLGMLSSVGNGMVVDKEEQVGVQLEGH